VYIVPDIKLVYRRYQSTQHRRNDTLFVAINKRLLTGR